ncbi:MAG: hypothetical protein CMP29_08305 [Roseibacillus sp.]|nr:hypothetical protein [Roseibacillus sp.]
MPRSQELKTFIKRRPPWFWWMLAQLLAGAFAVASWSFCLFLFSVPERPWNYETLRKLGRISPVQSYDPIEAPEGASADPQLLLSKFYSLSSAQLAAHNLHFKRNYITNFTKPEVVHYVEGTYQLTSTRQLTEADLFYPGMACRFEAIVRADELAEPSPYPVILELLLPLGTPVTNSLYPIGHQLTLKYLEHRALILHASRTGTAKEPQLCLTVVPLAFDNYQDPDGNPLPLAPPDPLRVSAQFPVLTENQPR